MKEKVMQAKFDINIEFTAFMNIEKGAVIGIEIIMTLESMWIKRAKK